jgi:hypothetical protein
MAKDFITPEQYQRGVGKIKNYVDKINDYHKRIDNAIEFEIANGTISSLSTYSQNMNNGDIYNKKYINSNKIIDVTNPTGIPILIIISDGSKYMSHKTCLNAIGDHCFKQNIYLSFYNNKLIQLIIYKDKNFDSSFNLVESKGCCFTINYGGNVTNEEYKYLDSLNINILLIDYNYLTLDNVVEYIPKNDYNPATKKYVDDNKAIVPTNISEFTNDSKYINQIKVLPVEYDRDKMVNVQNLEPHSIYIAPDDIDFLDLGYEGASGKLVSAFMSPNTELLIYTGNKTDKYISFRVGARAHTVYFKTDTESPRMEHSAYYLTPNNGEVYTPTSDYNPATKKYVDDKVAGIVNSAPETLDTLQELATALGNDANFATTVSTQIGKKVDKVDGMSLTHNDLTKELKANYDAAYEYSQAKHSYNDLTDKPTIPSIAGLATTEYVDSKSLPILFLDDSNRTGDKLFPLLPEHNLVFLAGDAQFTDENGNINIIYGLCYSDLQSDGSKLLTEYRTSKSASISANGTLKSFDYIDEYTKTILTLFKNAPSGKVLVKNQDNTFEWVELPTNPDLSSYAPITSPVFKKSISIGNVAPDKTLGENSIIVSSYGEASGIYTLSNGKSAIARADYSHAEGYASMSKGLYSHAEGEQTGAIGQSSHSEGHGGDATGVASHAEGYYTTSNGKYSHAEGYRTIATGDNQHAQGKYNIEDKDNKYAHIVGNGYRDERNYKDYRSNGYTLDWSGNGWFAGKVTQEGTPTDDKDLVNKKYVDDANIEATDEEVDAMLLEVLGGDYSVQS